MLSNITIKSKLTLLLMATSAMAVSLVCLTFYILVGQHFHKTYHRDLDNLAEILGHNCQAALLFNVPEDAQTLLSSLNGRHSVIAARLYDKDGQLFAAYDTFPAALVRNRSEKKLDSSAYLKVERAITLKDGAIAGTIVLYDDIRDIAISKKKGAYILAVAGIAALLVAFVLASYLQSIISHPLLALTSAVQRLAAGDFKARHDIKVQSKDEIGMLSASFIDMGRKLDDSYSQLELYSHTLEKRVAERTEELQQTFNDLAKSQAQLVQSEKMVALGQLVAGVAHEINNTITFIAGALPSLARQTQILSERLVAYEQQRPAEQEATRLILQRIDNLLRNAEEGVSRTKKIVLDLNLFARPSHGHFTKTDIHAELDMVLTLLQYDLKGRIEVHRDYSPELPLVSCLRDQMNQVFMNILRNACQAIQGTGGITIKTRLVDGVAIISFTDSGSGISPMVKDKVFDPFFTTKQVGEGTGLGLSISYGIMKTHKGKIMVESSSSQGTTFVLHLPVDSKVHQIEDAGRETTSYDNGYTALFQSKQANRCDS